MDQWSMAVILHSAFICSILVFARFSRVSANAEGLLLYNSDYIYYFYLFTIKISLLVGEFDVINRTFSWTEYFDGILSLYIAV